MRAEFEALSNRRLPNDGFPENVGGILRPDATAWAAICLGRLEAYAKVGLDACNALVSAQSSDGRVPVDADHPDAFWPTPIAILAWSQFEGFEKPRERAIGFLLDVTGVHWTKRDGSPVGHDTSLRGWPWTTGTHSWVEPTSLVLQALAQTGYGHEQRAREAVALLLDRQLPTGGWNYGNTAVFSQTLNPMPVPTGMALQALSGATEHRAVETSISYLKSVLPSLLGAKSLGWGLLGLSAWHQDVSNASQLVDNCLQRQKRRGPLATTDLAVLLLGASAYDTYT